jgi:hypothetical protein
LGVILRLVSFTGDLQERTRDLADRFPERYRETL